MWENLGWHFMAIKGQCKVHKHGERHYWASLETKLGQFCHASSTPRLAVAGIVKAIEKVRAMALDLKF